MLEDMKLYTVHVALPNVMRPCCQCAYRVVVVLNLYTEFQQPSPTVTVVMLV